MSKVETRNQYQLPSMSSSLCKEGSELSAGAHLINSIDSVVESQSMGSTKRKHAVRNSILAGSMAGIVSTMLFHPMDVIRTKMQSNALSQQSALLKSSSPVSVFIKTIQHGGYKSLYTGMELPLLAQTLYKATIFSVNQALRTTLMEYRGRQQRVPEDQVKLGLADTFACGAIGGIATALLWVTPVEYVRNQLIAQHTRLAAQANFNNLSAQTLSSATTTTGRTLNGPLDVIRTTLSSPSGIRGLWRGVGVTMARDGLGCGMFFVAFDLGKTWIPRVLGEHHAYTSTITTVGAGAMAGIGFWLAALPLDTLKTLVQTGTSACVRSTVLEMYQGGGGSLRGLHSLFSGWQVAFARGAPSAVAILATYELCHDTLERIAP